MYILDKLNSLIWDICLVFLLTFTGLLYTVRLGFVQLKMPSYLLKNKINSNKGISQLKTICMSLGTAMGTGNITGVAAALAIGGPGAIFWMWAAAFGGMAIVYGENILSVMYSDKKSKGPAAYLEKGARRRKTGVFFSVMCILAALGMGGMVQVNSFSESLRSCIEIKPVFTAFALFIVIYSVISGGAERIGAAAQFLLPIVTLIYVFACFAVIFTHISFVPKAVVSIFRCALGYHQFLGGISGTAISVGIRRGIFSNEAGLGSSPILHSAAESDSREYQGMWSMFEVFFDTMICCTLTALTILCSSEDMSVYSAFSSVLGDAAGLFMAAEMAVFAFCTLIGWYYCGETSFVYVFGESKKRIFTVIFALIASSGVLFKADAVWTLADIFNGLMAFPNIYALLLLRNKVEKE